MVRAYSLSWGEKRAIVDRPFFICHYDPSRLEAVGNQSEQTSKQAQEPSIFYRLTIAKGLKLMALVLACMG